MAIRVKWLGHSGFQLDISGTTILIDPFLTGNPLAPCQAKDLNADFILISHGHGDHIGDAPEIARRTGATVVANCEVATWFQNTQGIESVHTLNTGGGVQLSFGRVELTPALHSSPLPDGSYGGEPNGILIFPNEGKVIYHAGDTAPFLDMQLIGARGIDLAMLPIGDYFTMGPDASLQVIEMLYPKAVIPMHYNTSDVIVQDVVKWAQRVHNETESKPVVLDPGGSYTLE